MKITVVDIETTGLQAWHDRIVQVGAVLVDTDSVEISELYCSTCNPEIDKKIIKNSWICQQGHIHIDDIINAPSINHVAKEFKTTLKHPWTAYNIAFENSFLSLEPWRLPNTDLPCIMEASTPICKIPNPYGYPGYKWPKLEEAYQMLLKRPLINGHLALDDAFHAGELLLKLIETNDFL